MPLPCQANVKAALAAQVRRYVIGATTLKSGDVAAVAVNHSDSATPTLTRPRRSTGAGNLVALVALNTSTTPTAAAAAAAAVANDISAGLVLDVPPYNFSVVSVGLGSTPSSAPWLRPAPASSSSSPPASSATTTGSAADGRDGGDGRDDSASKSNSSVAVVVLAVAAVLFLGLIVAAVLLQRRSQDGESDTGTDGIYGFGAQRYVQNKTYSVKLGGGVQDAGAAHYYPGQTHAGGEGSTFTARERIVDAELVLRQSLEKASRNVPMRYRGHPSQQDDDESDDAYIHAWRQKQLETREGEKNAAYKEIMSMRGMPIAKREAYRKSQEAQVEWKADEWAEAIERGDPVDDIVSSIVAEHAERGAAARGDTRPAMRRASSTTALGGREVVIERRGSEALEFSSHVGDEVVGDGARRTSAHSDGESGMGLAFGVPRHSAGNFAPLAALSGADGHDASGAAPLASFEAVLGARLGAVFAHINANGTGGSFKAEFLRLIEANLPDLYDIMDMDGDGGDSFNHVLNKFDATEDRTTSLPKLQRGLVQVFRAVGADVDDLHVDTVGPGASMFANSAGAGFEEENTTNTTQWSGGSLTRSGRARLPTPLDLGGDAARPASPGRPTLYESIEEGGGGGANAVYSEAGGPGASSALYASLDDARGHSAAPGTVIYDSGQWRRAAGTCQHEARKTKDERL